MLYMVLPTRSYLIFILQTDGQKGITYVCEENRAAMER